MFERSILRIFVSIKMNNDLWRTKHISELNKLIKNKNLINHIKSLRFGQINRMKKQKLFKSIHKWKVIISRSWVRPKTRWRDDLLIDLKIMKANNCMKTIQNQNGQRRVIKAKNLIVEL